MTKESFLSWLLGSELKKTFFSEYWDKELLLIKRNDPGFFFNVMNIQDFDRLLSYVNIPYTNFDMAKDSKPIPKSEFCDGMQVNIAKALRLHRDGATIILRAIHLWSEPLEKLRQHFEYAFCYPVQINVYLTPPENQSTPPHWDTHDLFILQLEGSKRWKIYESGYEYPLEDQDFIPGKHHTGRQSGDYLMEAGDVMYLPRGVIHEPQSTTYSVHAAVGIKVVRYVDVLAQVLDSYSRLHSGLRRTLPLSLLQDPSSAGYLKEQFGYLFAEAGTELIQHTVSQLSQQLRTYKPISMEGKLTSIAQPCILTGDMTIHQNCCVDFQLNADSERLHLDWNSQRFSLPVRYLPAMDFIIKNPVFRIEEIPEDTTLNERIAIVDSLIEGGFLKLAPAETGFQAVSV